MSGVTRRTLLARAGIAGLGLAAASVPPAVLGVADALGAARWPASWTRELVSELRGGVLLPTNPRYLTSQALYNSRFDVVFPQAIARPADAGDVQSIMAWAARHDVALAPRGGGHGYTGNAISTYALVVDLRAIDGTVLSDGGQLATVGGGTLSIDAIRVLSAAGLAIPTGSCPSVGLTGLALGGGIGALSRQYGLLADRIVAFTVVTADGTLRRADPNQNPDLYWALRGGGGGNLGIVTEMDVRTVPDVLESHIQIQFPWASADEALDTYLRTAHVAPDELTGDFALSRGSISGQPAVIYTGTWRGDPAQAAMSVVPLSAVPGATTRITQSKRLLAAMTAGHCERLSPEACRPVRFGGAGALGRSRFVAGSSYLAGPLSAAGRATILRASSLATPFLSGTRSIIIAAHGGQVAAVDPDSTAFPHRDVGYSVQFFAQSSGAWEDDDARAWARRARVALSPHATGAAYVNYLDLDQPGWQDAYYGRSLTELKAIKAKHDPNGRFRPQQGIPLA